VERGEEIHGKKPGSVMVESSKSTGSRSWRSMAGLKLSEAVSFQVHCDTQEEIDYFWNALTKEGREQPCGWLKDKFGVSWQIVPTVLGKMMTDSDTEITQRVTNAFLKMKKFDLAKLRQAYEGQAA
jgi:predicted 3-demethylubiquinone-9 3-methyltransferase (glyoxalase superfamily)